MSKEKEQYRSVESTQKISGIQFCIFNSHQIEKQSVVNVSVKEFYQDSPDGQRMPVSYSVLDPKMGVTAKETKCVTCDYKVDKCLGHFGNVDLNFPVFHIGFFRSVVDILQTICKNSLCARVLLSEEEMFKYHAKLRNPNLSYVAKKLLRKQIRDRAKKYSICPHCGYLNGQIKKVGTLKICLETQLKKSNVNVDIVKFGELANAVKFNKEIEGFQKYMVSRNVTAQDSHALFKAIPHQDIPLVLMTPNFSHPKDLIITSLAVPPNCLRPSVKSDIRSGTNEDDLTMKLSEIVLINNSLKKLGNQGVKMQMLADYLDVLQLQCGLYMNSEVSGLQPSTTKMTNVKALRGLVQRLKGKHGRFRGNLSGKRADFTARTVISPDPYLKIEQVGIPEQIAKLLTYPERVTTINKAWLKTLIRNGPDIHPGAVGYYRPGTEFKKNLSYGKKEIVLQSLTEGDIVERHLIDHDIVLFNRQPSLHKLSIMCLRAKIIPDRTFKFNECNCTPYNADFDGDEMNIHFPQTEEARAECLILMDNKSNLVTPKNGEILIAATQDFITGAYLLTLRDTFLDKRQISRLIGWLDSEPTKGIEFELPPPSILKPQMLWTGKQVISVLLRPNKTCPVKVNLRTKGRKYTKNNDLCFKDSYIVIRNSELLLGTLDKGTIGSGSKENIFYVLYKDWGKEAAVDAMLKFSRVTTFYLMNVGFSMGIGDVEAGTDLLKIKDNLLSEGYKKCDVYINNMKEGKLQCHPGMTEEQTLEAIILKELSAIRELAGKACFSQLDPRNSALIMAICGSKGSVINVSQMIACVGQQAISGKRVPNGFGDRSLPHFDRYCKHPVSRGFCQNSFYSGLFPTEFFFHTMAGREGLIDTAVKTAETGYMQRRLVKALEDLSIQYDMTVRNSLKEVIQFSYGGDSLDPTFMEGDGNPVNFPSLCDNITANFPSRDESIISPETIKEQTESTLKSEKFSMCSEIFTDELRKFTDEISEKVRSVLDSAYNLPTCFESCRLTDTQLKQFLDACAQRYTESTIEPGTAVGCLAAQSIGEPGTQMTLKTFHFAGVASMNITQGVPRIKEIINGSKIVSTPIVTAYIENDTDEEFARKMKGRIEKTTLTEVSQYIEEVHTEEDSYLLIQLDKERIKLLQLEVNAHQIAHKIVSSKLGIKFNQISVESNDSVILIASSGNRENITMEMQLYRDGARNLVIQGIPSVSRAFVHEDVIKGVKHYKIVAETDNLRDVMAVRGVIGAKCTSNSIFAAYESLGIEAARNTIVNEIRSVMENHGMSVDYRHVMLVADLMTYKGEPLGITRHGLAKMKESVLNLASFEKTADHLFDAAYYGQKDNIVGVSECIITGTPISLGTGAFNLLQKTEKTQLKERKLVFESPKYHIPKSKERSEVSDSN